MTDPLPRDELSMDALLRETERADCGALALFAGVVRDHDNGRTVVRLEYTAHESLAARVIADIESETEAAGATVCRIVHRLGMLEVGDTALLVVVRAPHRAAAFDALRDAVEAVKHRVPVWKEQFFPDGTSEYVPGCSLVVEPAVGRAVVVVLSDRVAHGEQSDTAGVAVANALRSAGFSVDNVDVLPDDADVLTRYMREHLAAAPELIVTVGGTGVGPRDITVDTVKTLLDLELPGVMEAARAYGQTRTPRAMLSRGVAGVAGRTAIVTLPGSRTGATESLAAILPGLGHLADVVRGHDGHEGGYS